MRQPQALSWRGAPFGYAVPQARALLSCVVLQGTASFSRSSSGLSSPSIARSCARAYPRSLAGCPVPSPPGGVCINVLRLIDGARGTLRAGSGGLECVVIWTSKASVNVKCSRPENGFRTPRRDSSFENASRFNPNFTAPQNGSRFGSQPKRTLKRLKRNP